MGAISNFGFLAKHDQRLALLGAQAEGYFHQDSVVCLMRLRQFAEVLAQEAAAHLGLYASPEETQIDLLRRLRGEHAFTRDVSDVFHHIRKLGNRVSWDG